MAQADAPGVRTGKPLIERDRAEGTTVHDPNGNRIGRGLAEQRESSALYLEGNKPLITERDVLFRFCSDRRRELPCRLHIIHREHVRISR